MLYNKTKIICTMGPSTDSEEVLRGLIENGMDVARRNFSHGTHESQQKTIDMVKKVREEMGVPIAIMLDTKGPEYRIRTFENGSVVVPDEAHFTFWCDERPGSEKGVSVSYPNLCKELEVGDTILVNDGLVNFRVDSIEGVCINCTAVIGGKISDRKSMSFPGKVLKQEYLSQQDKDDLLFGIKNDVDFVACSFVSNSQNIIDLRNFLKENGGGDIQLIAKIENRSGVDNAEDILDHCEGLMVARGDLGVEIPYTELPAIQKRLIHLCQKKGAVSVTATEMLESMIEKPRPTRAEISDVANAVFDGSSCIMLSGETAAGKYPVQAVQAMALIAIDAERHIDYERRFSTAEFDIADLTDALSHSAGQLAIDTKAVCIVSSTMSGDTARMVSRNRCPMPIIGMTCREKTYRQLNMYWNVIPLLVRQFHDLEDLILRARGIVAEEGIAKSGDVVVLTGGITNTSGGTKLIHADIIP